MAQVELRITLPAEVAALLGRTDDEAACRARQGGAILLGPADGAARRRLAALRF